MALKKVDFAAGFNKQSVASALPGQWVDGDFVRFRYGHPEKYKGIYFDSHLHYHFFPKKGERVVLIATFN